MAAEVVGAHGVQHGSTPPATGDTGFLSAAAAGRANDLVKPEFRRILVPGGVLCSAVEYPGVRLVRRLQGGVEWRLYVETSWLPVGREEEESQHSRQCHPACGDRISVSCGLPWPAEGKSAGFTADERGAKRTYHSPS